MADLIIGSIGTVEPGNAVGIGRDVTVVARYGLHARSAIAAISVQSDPAVPSIFPLPRHIFVAQLERLVPAHVLRVGALGTVENLYAAAEFLCARNGVPIVIDPVVRTSRGGALYADSQPSPPEFEALLSLPAIVTPNIEEAECLLQRRIHDVDAMKKAAVDLRLRGCTAVLLKGGHLPADPVDVLADETGSQAFSATRLPRTMRGTGCTLAAALACELALRRPLHDAVARARAYVRQRIACEGQPGSAVQHAPFA